MKVLVLGVGYVGSTMAACLAKSGHTMVGIDTNRGELATMAAGRSPVREPEVEGLLSAALDKGLLSTAADIKEQIPKTRPSARPRSPVPVVLELAVLTPARSRQHWWLRDLTADIVGTLLG